MEAFVGIIVQLDNSMNIYIYIDTYCNNNIIYNNNMLVCDLVTATSKMDDSGRIMLFSFSGS